MKTTKKTAKESAAAIKTCKLCKHEYMHPCNGKDETCMNGLWVLSGRSLRVYNEMRAALGLGVAQSEKSKRVRLVEDEPVKKKGRTRL